MKKHELLKYAYDNYPKGTKFKSAPSKIENVSNGKFIISCTGAVKMDKNERGTIIFSPINGWAEIVKEENRKPLLISEDGVKLFEGSGFHYVHLRLSKWSYLGFCPELKKTHLEITSPVIAKAFSTKEAAEKWIEEQNNPKLIELPSVSLSGDQVYVYLEENKIVFTRNGKPHQIHFLDIVDVQKIMNMIIDERLKQLTNEKYN